MNRKMLKVLACILTMCMLVGVLTACGGDGGSSSTPSSSAAPSSQTPSSTPASDSGEESTPVEGEDGQDEVVEEVDFPAFDLGGVTISLLAHSDLAGKDPNAEGLEEIDKADRQAEIDRIEQKYNVHLEFVPIPTENWDEIAETIVKDYTSGHPTADVMDAYYGFMGTYVANDILYDFTDTLPQSGLYKDGSYFEWLNRIWGVTSSIGGEGLYYNKKWIQELGMEYTPAEMFDMGKWSYDDFKQYLRDLKAKMAEDEYPLFVTAGYWMLFAPAANGEIILDPSGNLNYVTDPMLETLQVWQDLALDGLISLGDPVYNEDGSLAGYEGWSYPGNTFGQGNTIAIAHRAAWQAASEVANVELGFVPYPWGSNVTIDESKVGQPGAYLTLSDNFKTTYYDGQMICLTKGVEKKGDPVHILSMVLDLMGWKFRLADYEEDASTKTCNWLEQGLDTDLYFFSISRERLEPWNSIPLELTFSSRFMREGGSIRSNMIQYYNADMQIMIDNGYASPDVLETYSEE